MYRDGVFLAICTGMGSYTAVKPYVQGWGRSLLYSCMYRDGVFHCCIANMCTGLGSFTAVKLCEQGWGLSLLYSYMYRAGVFHC